MAFRAFVICALLACAGTAAAQQPVTLRFSDGRVSLRAQNAQVRTILAEWARLGGTTIVNGETVTGAPVTLELTDVPERQALDILLRSVAGYMLGPRRAGTKGVSAFDRIMILATSVAPRNLPPPPAAAPSAAAPRPVLRPPLLQRAPAVPPQAGDQIQPFPPDDQPVGIEAEVEQNPADDSTGLVVVGTPTTSPFGLPAGSSARPGVIAPVPSPQPVRIGPGPRVQPVLPVQPGQ